MTASSAFGALHARLGRDVLPAEQEAQEVARGDRLDLGAQPLDRVAMDARQQAALAPFVLGRAGVKRPRMAKPSASSVARPPRSRCSRPSGAASAAVVTGPRPFETAAQHLDQRLPRSTQARRSRRAPRSRARSTRRPQRAESGSRSAAIHTAGPSRDASAPRASGRASSASQSRQPASACDLGLGQEAEPDQRIVQLVGIGGVGPRLGLHPLDRLGIELAELVGLLGRRASGAPSPPGCGAPPAARRRGTRRAAPTGPRARAATAG